MVILWTNLEGEKLEPSPTAVVAPDGGRPNAGQHSGLKRRVQVALKPSLPSLFLPIINPSSPEESTSNIPDPPDDLVSDVADEEEEPELFVIRTSDISSPDSGVLVHYDSPVAPPPPSSTSPAPSSKSLSKKLPVIYGTVVLTRRANQTAVFFPIVYCFLGAGHRPAGFLVSVFPSLLLNCLLLFCGSLLYSLRGQEDHHRIG